ncbi:MAG: GAF domain-containing protein [Anaerolineales bacterium]|nr:GAF domain-containing protein [Anaerolineales bacterium]
MFGDSPEVLSIHKQFKDINTLFLSLAESLAKYDMQSLPATQELTRAIRILDELEQNVDLHVQKRQSQLGALMGTGSAINSSLGLKRVLEEVMDTLIALMRAERGFLMLREKNRELSVQTARGIDHIDLDHEAFAVSKTIVYQVVETGEPVLTTNAQKDPRFDQKMSVAVYQLRSILCVPLKIKDELIGVVYVDNRAHVGIFQESDLSLISAFADQAAVAIDNARLFENLKAANKELEIAYQATLEGWVRALDFRDKETEGHTQRVAALTQRLSKELGVDADAMIHITRGALLHDIGKMAIPDAILLKPAGLTDEERLLIQQHPVFAYEMLSPIDFLHEAIDIPYCHHEKWDGTGYPRGLKGDEIPFAARIFSVVDVWDALVSDRPYRKAMPHAEVRKHILEESEKHFDTRVVDAFLKLDEISK